MAEVINLNRFRKAKAKAEAAAEAKANRTRFGRNKEQKREDNRAKEQAVKDLDGKKLE